VRGSGTPPDSAEFTEVQLSDEVLGVRPEYLEAALATVREDYGSVPGYLQAAGLTAADIDRLLEGLRGFVN